MISLSEEQNNALIGSLLGKATLKISKGCQNAHYYCKETDIPIKKNSITFTLFYKNWYINKQKVLPKNLILTWEIISYWYKVSGKCKRNRFSLKTIFKEEDLIFLVDKLKEFGLQTTFKDKTIYIKKESYNLFADMLSLPKKGHKMHIEYARAIRRAYRGGETQQSLAKQFGVTQALVGRIVNNLIYKEERPINIGGESDYKVSYKWL